MEVKGKKEHLSENMYTEAERKEDERVEMLKVNPLHSHSGEKRLHFATVYLIF